ncbi:MAG: ABC transporter permease [Gemmatimonadaceae bacterium]|nr:ABC transporter permease [Gemmatimonadaceae bacterium]
MTEPGLFSPAAIAQDLRFAWRMLVKNPFFTAMVVLTLALGIGLNTAVFSVVEGLLLRPTPGVRDDASLVQLYRSYPGMLYGSNSVPHYLRLQERTTDVFEGVADFSFTSLNITVDERPMTVFAQMVSPNYFTLLGVTAARGRLFTPDETAHGAHPIAVLSDGAWRSLFAADPAVVGKTIPVNGQPYTIVGVVPREFRGTVQLVEPVLWVPLAQLEQVRPGVGPAIWESGNNYTDVIARLKPGVSVAQVESRMQALMSELIAELPDTYKESSITVVRKAEVGIHPTMRGAQVGMSMAVLAVVAILLVIACVNVANLFLARARDRAREMAIRLALGARRSALLRQLLVESLVFSLVSGAVGLLVATWTISVVNRISLPVSIPIRPELSLSPTVLAFALLASVLTGVVFGLAPALQATRPALIPALKGEAPAGGGRSRMSKGLVIAQMSLSIVLLVSAGLFLNNLRNATALDKGFVGDHLLLAELDPSLNGYSRGRTEEFYRNLMDRLTTDPQVRSAAIVSDAPLGLSTSDRGVDVPGYVPAEGESMSILYVSTTPGYFATMGIPLTKGRDFTARDDTASVPVLVVNERFVERFWPGQDALGKTVRTRGRDHTIIGVVPTGKYRRLGEEPTAYMYFAQAQAFQSSMSLVVRTAVDPEAVIPLLRRETQTLDANLPVSSIRTMDGHLGIALMPARLTGMALALFGVLGLLLASVGMYGVMSYSVSQRTREIGIRMAIGAAASDVIALVMRQGLTLVLVGTVIGLLAALGAAKLLAGVLYGGNSIDPMTFTLVPVLLIAVAAVATFAPARRAATVDPAITLRSD